MLKIKLYKMDQESAERQKIASYNPKRGSETTPAEQYTRGTLAARVLAQLFRIEGTQEQKENADQLARLAMSGGCVCDSLLWVRYSMPENKITLADGFRPACVGWVRGCDLLVLFTEKDEEERAYLVRW